jgi:hypothetical protein
MVDHGHACLPALQEEGNRHLAAPQASTPEARQAGEHQVKLLAVSHRPWYGAQAVLASPAAAGVSAG